MKLNRVLVIIKPHAGDAIHLPDSREATAIERQHHEALDAVSEELKRHGVNFDIVLRDEIPGTPSADLLIAIGGDGTCLSAAHAADGIPLLGVNPLPGRSVGFFCAATAGTFASFFSQLVDGTLLPRELPLIEASINGHALPEKALNDILFAGISPAETVRYEIRIQGKEEKQKSSGIWIAAGPGSTAAIAAAGGVSQSLDSRQLQYLVREPFCAPRPRYQLTHGVLAEREEIAITSHMKNAMLYLDGQWLSWTVPMGGEVVCRISPETLTIVLPSGA
jgi:NAD+ kinase